MRQLRRILAALLCFSLLCGCSYVPQLEAEGDQTTEQTEQPVSTPKTVLNLAYYGGDLLDPYLTTSEGNAQLCNLLFDKLLEVDTAWNIQWRLATGASFNADNTVVTVTLRSGVRFWDGSAFTAADAADCINEALKSTTNYDSKLSNIASVRAVDDTTLELTLREACAQQLYELDLPMLRRDGDDLVGTGRYEPGQAQSESLELTANDSWWGGKIGIGKILLSSMPDDDAINYAFSTGVIDLLGISPAEPNYQSHLGRFTRAEYWSGVLVYLGMNTAAGPCAQQAFRRYLCNALDGSDLCYENSREGWPLAMGDWRYDLPVEKDGKTYGLSQVQIEAGLTDTNADGLFEQSQQRPLTLIYVEGSELRDDLAQKLCLTFAQIGIQCQASQMTQTDFTAALQAQSYDLYLAQTLLPNSLDPGALAQSLGGLNFSAFSDPLFDQALSQWRAGGSTSDREQMLSVLAADAVFLPLFLRGGTVLISQSIEGTFAPCAGDVFYGMEQWSFAS